MTDKELKLLDEASSMLQGLPNACIEHNLDTDKKSWGGIPMKQNTSLTKGKVAQTYKY